MLSTLGPDNNFVTRARADPRNAHVGRAMAPRAKRRFPSCRELRYAHAESRYAGRSRIFDPMAGLRGTVRGGARSRGSVWGTCKLVGR